MHPNRTGAIRRTRVITPELATYPPTHTMHTGTVPIHERTGRVQKDGIAYSYLQVYAMYVFVFVYVQYTYYGIYG